MPRTRAGRLIHGGRNGRLLLMAVALASALAIFVISEVTGRRFGEAILFGFVISLTLAAGGFGLRGGLLVGLLCGCLAAVWWLQHGQYEGTAWIVSRAAACIAVGVLLGWFLDQARRLLQGPRAPPGVLARHVRDVELRRALHAREPIGHPPARLHARGVPRQAVPRADPPGRHRAHARGGRPPGRRRADPQLPESLPRQGRHLPLARVVVATRPRGRRDARRRPRRHRAEGARGARACSTRSGSSKRCTSARSSWNGRRGSSRIPTTRR